MSMVSNCYKSVTKMSEKNIDVEHLYLILTILLQM